MFERVYSRVRGRSAGELAGLVVKNIAHLITALSPQSRARRAQDHAFDRRWGTDTSGGISVHDLGFDRAVIAQCNRYEASDAAMLQAPVEALELDPSACDFIDYGAGKGRVVMLAMAMGFRTVTGVELAESLCRTARENIQRFQIRSGAATPATILQCDATAFSPEGKHIVAYFFNPFGAQIMDAVRGKLEEALAGGTERVTIIYANPEQHAVFASASGWMEGPSLPGIATFVGEAASFRH